jgi:hypothetical protein
MRKWSEFGDQVNRLVYTLKGEKTFGSIESANRYIAERIAYSEVTVRMIRQGRFRPQDDLALEKLVEIGHEIGMGKEWACRLLSSGRHPAPQSIIERLYHTHRSQPESFVMEPSESDLPEGMAGTWVARRILGGAVGLIAMLLVWTYFINNTYPPQHELPLELEALWGLLVGSGLALGLTGVDWSVSRQIARPLIKPLGGLRYLMLPLMGAVGGFSWNILASNIFSQLVPGKLASTWMETLFYGLVYGLMFGMGTALAAFGEKAPCAVDSTTHGRRYFWHATARYTKHLWLRPSLFTLIVGVFSLGGFLLAVNHPAFNTQRDIDIIVGVTIRIGLLLAAAVLFPSQFLKYLYSTPEP